MGIIRDFTYKAAFSNALRQDLSLEYQPFHDAAHRNAARQDAAHRDA